MKFIGHQGAGDRYVLERRSSRPARNLWSAAVLFILSCEGPPLSRSKLSQ